jgi:hypothetical protein
MRDRPRIVHVLLRSNLDGSWTALCGRKGRGANVVPAFRTLKPLQNLGHTGGPCKACEVSAVAREQRRLSRRKSSTWEPSDPAEVICKALTECRTPPTLHQLKLAYVRAAMIAHDGNTSLAANMLGVDRATVTALVRRYL